MMRETPLVSICIPAYHARRYINNALEGLRLQTFSCWELIVVEDGSDDGTRKMVEDFSESVVQSVRYIRHEVNQSLPVARNTAIESAKGSVIALLDSDDYWKPNHLEECIRLLETGYDFVHGGCILFNDATGAVIEKRAPTSAELESVPVSIYTGKYIIQPSSAVFFRKIWEQVNGFDTAFRYVEDRAMWFRCLRVGARIGYTGHFTCMYRKHETALSTHAAEMAMACARLYQQHLDWEDIPKKVRRSTTAEAWIAAGRILRRSDPIEATKCFDNALRLKADVKSASYWIVSNIGSLLRGFSKQRINK